MLYLYVFVKLTLEFFNVKKSPLEFQSQNLKSREAIRVNVVWSSILNPGDVLVDESKN